MKTKDLKKLYFEEIDSDAQNRWKSEITPLTEFVSC